MRNRYSRILAGAVWAVVLAACSPAPPGTQYWVQAHGQYEAGDYEGTLAYLNDVLTGENDFSQRAAAWKVVILGAMTRTAIEFEQACAEGIHRVPDWESRPYKTCITQYRRYAKVRVLTLIDAVMEFEKISLASEMVELDFPLPQASSSVSAIVNRIRVGSMATDDVLEAAVSRTIDRNVILQCRDITGANEASDVVEMFETLPVTTSKARFLLGVTKTLVTAAGVFEQDRLNDPGQRAMVLHKAHDWLNPALDEGSSELQTEAQKLAREIRMKLK